MPSLTLRSGGNDRSVIRRHLPGVCPFGTTPIRLRWTCRAASGGRGPTRRPVDVRCHYRLLCRGGGHVPGDRPYGLAAIEADAETIFNAIHQITAECLVRVSVE